MFGMKTGAQSVAENTRSDGTDVAGTPKYVFATPRLTVAIQKLFFCSVIIIIIIIIIIIMYRRGFGALARPSGRIECVTGTRLPF